MILELELPNLVNMEDEETKSNNEVIALKNSGDYIWYIG